MTFQTIPPISEMTSDQLADLLDAVQIERFKRRDEPPPEWHLKVLEELEKVTARGERQHSDLEDFKELVRKEISDKGIRRGIEDVKAGRVKPAEQVFRELEEKFGIPHDS